MQHELSRRSLLVGTAASAGTSALGAGSPIGIDPDGELLDLRQIFAQALAAYQTARVHYNQSEKLYFARRPQVPQALTESGPLGHLLPSWLHWSAAELRQILKNPSIATYGTRRGPRLRSPKPTKLGRGAPSARPALPRRKRRTTRQSIISPRLAKASLPRPGTRSRDSRLRHTSSRLGANPNGGTPATTAPRLTSASPRKFSTPSSRWRKRGGSHKRSRRVRSIRTTCRPVGGASESAR